MSRKSDNDNRSNQLNPNNAEYLNCRGEGGRGSATGDYYDEYDEPRWNQSGWLRSTHGSNTERTERKQYYFAATTFDGTAVYVRFVTEVQFSYLAGSQHGRYLAEVAKEALLRFMQGRCSLGVAYWRLATDDSRGEFYWYTPGLSLNDQVEYEKVLRWNTAVRDRSQKLDLLFDWGKHDTATDLGVIKDETMTFAPESDDLLKWSKQQSS